MKMLAIQSLLCAALCAQSANQVLLRSIAVPATGQAAAITTDKSGNVFVASLDSIYAPEVPHILVAKTSPNGTLLATLSVPGTPGALATDSRGDLVLTGTSSAALGFSVVNPLFPSATKGGFVMKLDPQLETVLFSTFVNDGFGGGGAVALDGTGNIYLGGDADAPGVPTTPGAFQTTPPNASGAYLMEISPDGDKLLYATYFGGDEPPGCLGLGCVGPTSAGTGVSALAVGPSGQVVIAGSTDAINLPVTAGAFDLLCGCVLGDFSGFLAVFSPDTPLKLSWATYVPEYAVTAVAFDAAGNVIAGGVNVYDSYPVTWYAPWRATGANGFVAKVSADGTTLAWSKPFGGWPQPPIGGWPNLPSTYAQGVTGLAVDSQGQIVITGSSQVGQFPDASGSPILGSSYVARLSSDGATVEDLFAGPANSTGTALALTPTGSFVSLGISGSMWIETTAPGPSLLAIANAASGPVSSAVAPDEIVSLYGYGIGPQSPLLGQVQNGVFTSSLGGYQVLFNGIAAPLLYAGPTQINAVVPYGVASASSASVQLVTPSGTVAGPTLAVAPAIPYIFQSVVAGTLAVVNQDGTINSGGNPANAGSVVSIFASGGAVYGTDGAVAGDASLPAPALPVLVLGNPGGVAGTPLQVLYAGQAPEEITGLMQVNFRLPAALPSGVPFGVVLQVGGVQSNFGTIHVSP